VEQNARIAYMLAQLGVSNPLPPEEVKKLLEQRAAMGLCRPGEKSEFCDICGVCHTGANHAPTMRPGSNLNSSLEIAGRSTASGPHTLPPIRQPAVDDKTIRDLVTQIVQKTLGETS